VNQLRYTLTCDGPSDRSLMAVIDWILIHHNQLSDIAILPQFADPRESPSLRLTDRLPDAIRRFPCDILFIHRDAERESREKRQEEIDVAISKLAHTMPFSVPVIPVRMTEAWLLIDEPAIRMAADNPNGSVILDLPGFATLESLPDPKGRLNQLLIAASEKTGRKLDKFKRPRELAWRRGRVASLIDNYSSLRSLDAFKVFEHDFNLVINQLITNE